MTYLRNVVAMFVAPAFGFWCWYVISPGEEGRKENIKNMPVSSALRTEEMRQRNILVMQALKAAAETNENISARPSGPAQ